MIVAETITATEEKLLLSGWFDTVQFDVDYHEIPVMDAEEDDEESRSRGDAKAITEWFLNSGTPPLDISDGAWSYVDESVIGMSRSTARAILQKEIEFHQLFLRANPYHDKAGKFVSGPGGGVVTKSPQLTETHAATLRSKLRQPDGGFTLNPRDGKEVTSGFAVAVHESRSLEIPEKDLIPEHLVTYTKDNSIWDDPRNMLGGWHDPESGHVWLDVSTVVKDRDEAIALAKEHNQISIFHLDNFEVINTGGTGRSIWLLAGRAIADERIAAYGRWRMSLRHGDVAPKGFRFNPHHDKTGKFASDTSKGTSKALPPLEAANIVPGHIEGAKDPVTGEQFSANTGSPWQSDSDPEMRAGGVWSEYHDGMHNTRQITRNRNNGRPDMENVDPERGWLTNYQRVGEVQYGYNGPRLGEVIREGKVYSKEDMGVDLRNAATVLQHKLDTAPTHRSPLYRGMRMNSKDIPKQGDTFQSDISSWSKSRNSAEVFAYGAEAPRLGIVGDHHVVMRMVGSKKSADIGDIVASGVMNDEHIASGKYKVNRVTRNGKSVNVEVEQIND